MSDNDAQIFMTYSMLAAILKAARKQAWGEGFEEGQDRALHDEWSAINPYEEVK